MNLKKIIVFYRSIHNTRTDCSSTIHWAVPHWSITSSSCPKAWCPQKEEEAKSSSRRWRNDCFTKLASLNWLFVYKMWLIILYIIYLHRLLLFEINDLDCKLKCNLRRQWPMNLFDAVTVSDTVSHTHKHVGIVCDSLSSLGATS